MAMTIVPKDEVPAVTLKQNAADAGKGTKMPRATMGRRRRSLMIRLSSLAGGCNDDKARLQRSRPDDTAASGEPQSPDESIESTTGIGRHAAT
jgi:hypothetical protein